MKLRNRLVITMMVVCLLASNITYVNAATSMLNQNDRANILNSLSILIGNGGSDYNLNGQLKRSEAATFIVRLLGEEANVKKDADKYSYTSYTDVSPDEWYAPYVGYCSKNGIIDGFSDKTFKPDDYLSEKAFLKMVLATLGYRYDIDYTWNSVFYFSYQVGIVADINYTTKKDDDFKYKRGSVVDVLYDALRKETRETKVRLIQRFIDASLITKERAVQYGFIDDAVETDLETVTVVSENVIEVTFNEALKDLTKEQISINENSALRTSLKIKEVVKLTTGTSKYKVTLETKQSPDAEYILFVTPVKDSLGNESGSFTKSFKGYRPDIILSDYFRISYIEPVSENVINVFFTQPINDNALYPSFYTLKSAVSTVVTGTPQIGRIASNNKGISIYYKNYKLTEDSYELTIDGSLLSDYVVPLNGGKGDSVNFKSSKATNEVFKVSGLSTNSSHVLEIDFSKVINPVRSKQIYSYELTSSSGSPMKITKAEVVEGTGKTVKLTTEGTFVKDQKYNILINYIEDSTGIYSIVNEQYEVLSSFTTATDVKISEVFAFDLNTVLFRIDRPLDYDTATVTTNFYIYGYTNSSFSTTPAAIYYDKLNNPLTIKLYLPEGKGLEANKSYDLRMMTGVKDAQGNLQSSIVRSAFSSGENPFLHTNISEAITIGENTIKVTFSKEIAGNLTNLNKNNYWLSFVEDGVSYKKIPTSAIYVNPTTMILKFDSLNAATTYTAMFNKLVNYGNMETDNSNGKYKCIVVKGQ